ncbi:hypothetical protein PGQ11_012491 [Apiospora arundinis]|uniref:Uncharacterized protein n=1 Tax=Apiospora arundinis TaxID=335852 RepID=A0ABR2I2G5_9PEZI
MVDSRASRHGYSCDILATAFVTAGYLALVFFTAHYLVAYDPRRGGVDSVVLRWPRWCVRKLETLILGDYVRKQGSPSRGIASSLGGWLRLCLVNLADTQLILGLMLLYALFEATSSVVSAAQWQFVMHLAWFPVLACLCGISVLSDSSPATAETNGSSRRRGFHQEWPKLCRALLLAVLVGSILVGFVPTVFFNWEVRGHTPSAATPDTDARRFLSDFAGELERFHRENDDIDWRLYNPERYRRVLRRTHGFQLAVFSVVSLLFVTFLVLGKAATSSRKKHCPQQESSNFIDATNAISRWLGVERGIRLEDFDDIEMLRMDMQPKQRSLGGIVRDAAAFFIAFNLDLLTSRFMEIFLLFLLQSWGVARLYGSAPKSMGQIPNGQTLWRFSQQLPMVLLIVPFILATNAYLLSGNCSAWSSSKCQTVGQSAGEDDGDEQGATLLPVHSSQSPVRPPSGLQYSDNDNGGDGPPTEVYPTPWLGVSLVCASGLLLAMAIAFFAAIFNMCMGWEPQCTISEALFTALGMFWVWCPGYPLACFATALAAGIMERCWVHKRRKSSSTTAAAANSYGTSSSWRVWDFLSLLAVGGVAHAFPAIILLVYCISPA